MFHGCLCVSSLGFPATSAAGRWISVKRAGALIRRRIGPPPAARPPESAVRPAPCRPIHPARVVPSRFPDVAGPPGHVSERLPATPSAPGRALALPGSQAGAARFLAPGPDLIPPRDGLPITAWPHMARGSDSVRYSLPFLVFWGPWHRQPSRPTAPPTPVAPACSPLTRARCPPLPFLRFPHLSVTPFCPSRRSGPLPAPRPPAGSRGCRGCRGCRQPVLPPVAAGSRQAPEVLRCGSPSPSEAQFSPAVLVALLGETGHTAQPQPQLRRSWCISEPCPAPGPLLQPARYARFRGTPPHRPDRPPPTRRLWTMRDVEPPSTICACRRHRAGHRSTRCSRAGSLITADGIGCVTGLLLACDSIDLVV